MITGLLRKALVSLALLATSSHAAQLDAPFINTWAVEGIRLGVEVGATDVDIEAFNFYLPTSAEPWAFTIDLYQGDVFSAIPGILISSWGNLPFSGSEIFSSGFGVPTFIDTDDFALSANTNYYFEIRVQHLEYDDVPNINKDLMNAAIGVPGGISSDRNVITGNADMTLLEGGVWNIPQQEWTALSAAFAGSLIYTTPVALVPGDVDLDGILTVSDLLLLEQAITGQVTLTPTEFANADTAPSGGDGQLDVRDVLELSNLLTGN